MTGTKLIMKYEEKLKFFQSLTGVLNTHIYVDLGLSVKWATCNIGANRSEEFGNLFTFGSIVDYGRNMLRDKYTLPEELIQMSCISGTKFDAATQIWGKGWRLPSLKEFQELCYHTISEYFILNGIPGALFKSKINDNSIFLPFAGSGYRDNIGTRESVYGLGDYWAGDGCYTDCGLTLFAKLLDLHYNKFSSTIYNTGGGRNIYCAASIRAVTDVDSI